jgi:bifunctional DNase/RNase
MIAATGTGLLPMRVGKVVGLKEGDEFFEFVVLDQLGGDEHLIIGIGSSEAFALAASLSGTAFGCPMTYQFMSRLVRSLGGRVREVRLDRMVEGAYAATVEAEGSQGIAGVDARCSDALNLAVLAGVPIFAAPEVLADCTARQEGGSAEAALLRRVLAAGPMTVSRPQQDRADQPPPAPECVPDEPR